VPTAAERLETIAPGYLARVRRAAARLGVRPTSSATSGDLDILLEDLADQTQIDAEVPTASRQREVRLLKVAVKRLTGWYLRYLAQQVTALGESVSRLGRELAARSDALEVQAQATDATVTALTAELEGLRRRVEQLELGEVGKDPHKRSNPQPGEGPE
jgi:hypothetical protein